jgi:mannose-1-phosphate guanylyltransferase/mannose-6-phosphate isomerase
LSSVMPDLDAPSSLTGTSASAPSPGRVPILPVILGGGIGARLWPLSRADTPKQMLTLWGAEPMIIATIRRLKAESHLPPLIVCGADQEILINSWARDRGLDVGALLLEPVGRNTAPAIAVAALHAAAISPETLLIVQPADHAVADTAPFHDALRWAGEIARAQGKLVLLGARPSRAETGYGYIEFGDRFGDPSPAARVRRFVEKPEMPLAEEFVRSGSWLWNMGTFVFTAQAILEELALVQPHLLSQCRTAFSCSSCTGTTIRLDREAFSGADSISIDHAVMEKSQRLAVVPLECGWTDLGSWSALWEIENRDSQGNVVAGDVEYRDTERSYLRADNGLLVSIGLRDIVVISTGDAVLVADKNRSQELKAVVDSLRDSGRREVRESRRSRRPWGSLETVADGHGFKVRRIRVEPGGELSLQLHHHRAEHWVIVRGSAIVEVDNERRIRHKNETVFVPAGAKHRITNNGSEALELIEVQIGNYLGEDDTVRLADNYGRV